MWYRHKRGYPWEVIRVSNHRMGKTWGPVLWLSEFEDHIKPDKLLLQSEAMWMDQYQVGKYMNYRQDQMIRSDATFDDEGNQIKTYWTFWEDGMVSQECPYVKGERKGEGFHFHPDIGGVCVHRFYRNDRIQGKEKFYECQNINWLVDICQDSRILRRIKLHELDPETNRVNLHK